MQNHASSEPLAETVLAAACPSCNSRVRPSDIFGTALVVQCSRCSWSVRASLPRLRKTVVYLDTSTLSHMAKAIERGNRNLWTDLVESLQRGVEANVIVCPSAPIIDDEAQLAPAVSRSVRELSRRLGHVRLRHFATVQEAASRLAEWRADPRPGILLTGDIDTMARLVDACPEIRAVNIGGIHHREGRTLRLRYVYLSPDEEAALRELAGRGVSITAQDVPSARPIPLEDVLEGGSG